MTPDSLLTSDIRPEDLTPTDDGPITGTVGPVEHPGDATIVHLDGPGGSKPALKGPGDWSLTLGDRLSLVPDPTRARLFDAQRDRIPA